MGFSREEYWNGWPFPSSVALSNPGLEPAAPAPSSALQANSSLPSHWRRSNPKGHTCLENPTVFPEQCDQGHRLLLATETTDFIKALLFSCSVVSDSLWSYGLQHARLPCPSPSPEACSNSCPLSQWVHPTVSSSVIPFYTCLQSFPESGSFLMSQLFASGSQSISASASASVLPINIPGWFPSGLTGLISSQSKRLWRVFSSTTRQKHQFFNTQLSLWSNKGLNWQLMCIKVLWVG